MSNFKYEFEKQKQKIFVGMSVIAIGLVGFGMYSYISNNKNEPTPEPEVLVDKEAKLADYIFTANENGVISLIGVEDKTVKNEITLESGDKYIYSRDNDLEKLMAYKDGTFTEITEVDGSLVKNEIIKTDLKDIKTFKFNDDFIVAIGDKDLSVISIKNNTTTKKAVTDIDSYTVYKEHLIYSTGNSISVLNLLNNEEKVIDVGEKTDAIFVVNNETIIAYNKFGTGLNKYTLLQLSPSDLFITNAYKHENSNVLPITPDSDDTKVSFIDISKKNNLDMQSLYTLDINEEKNNKKRVSLPTSEEEDLEYLKNAVATKGYMYTNKENGIEIFDLRGESVKDTVSVNDSTFFMPILK